MDAVDPVPYEPPPLRPGQLTVGWKTVFIAGWVGVMAGFGAVAQAGRIAGLSPWWLGPETNPRQFIIIGLPFVAPVVCILAAVRNLTSTCYIGIAAGLVSMAFALGDADFPGMALVEAAIGLAGLLISVACLAGRTVRPPEAPEPDPPR